MKGIVYSLLFSLRYSFTRKKVLEVFKLPGQTFRQRLIFASSHVGVQGRHGVFLAGKEDTVAAPSAACRRRFFSSKSRKGIGLVGLSSRGDLDVCVLGLISMD